MNIVFMYNLSAIAANCLNKQKSYYEMNRTSLCSSNFVSFYLYMTDANNSKCSADNLGYVHMQYM